MNTTGAPCWSGPAAERHAGCRSGPPLRQTGSATATCHLIMTVHLPPGPASTA
ncbi:hypothetical protein [Streptomyces sp. NPDC052494]|uniref:hypothetical protein n=1 Tax=Streptomyces sp. NPDC052494 TaxID=3365692 RepID=UPI0037D3B65A